MDDLSVSDIFSNLRIEINTDKISNKSVINNNTKNSKIIKEIQHYINIFFPKQIKKLTNMIEISSSIQEFVSEISNSYLSLNNIQAPSINQIEICMEAFEDLITKSLYPQLIALIGSDSKFSRLLNKFSFLNINHFNLELNLKEKFEFAKQIQIFGEIAEIASPKEKMNYITLISRFILSHCTQGNLIKGLMFTILKSKVKNIKTHLRYISLFRSKSLITNEEEFYLFNMFKAFEAVENLSVNMKAYINMSQEKFKELCDNYDKKDIFESIKFNNGHFTQNFFIDDRLLALVNSEKENSNQNIINEEKQSDVNNNIDLLKAKYINKPFSNISIRELKEIKHAFNNLLLIAKQTQNSNS